MKIDGIEVIDSKVDRALAITKTHIKKSARKDGWGCAAQCCAVGQVDVKGAMINVAVSYLLQGEGEKQRWHRYWTSKPLRTEIISFDRSGIFTPGEYLLLAIPKSARVKTGKAHSLGAPKHGRPGHHRRTPHVTEGVRAHAMCGLRTNGHDMIHGRPQTKKDK